jgi:hypothetical protein
MQYLTLYLIKQINRIYSTINEKMIHQILNKNKTQRHTKKQTKKIQKIIVVHILYNSYPSGFTKDSIPLELICWPGLADKLIQKYGNDPAIRLEQIILNIDPRFGIKNNDDLQNAIETKICSLQTENKNTGIYHKIIPEKYTSETQIIDQLKLVCSNLPDDILYNFIYFGNTNDLNYNPFTLTKYNPQLFAPPYINNSYSMHMLADVCFSSEYTSLKWQPDKEFTSYELQNYKIPALLELIKLYNRKIICPVTGNPLNIHDMIDIPLTHASLTISTKQINLCKGYLKVIFYDTRFIPYIDDLMDELFGKCVIDSLQTYNVILDGNLGSASFQHTVPNIVIMLLENIITYKNIAPKIAKVVFKPVISMISSGNFDKLISACQDLVDNLHDNTIFDI